jgi:hypothetical protein
MSSTAQKRAIKNYRNRLAKRGMARFEVVALDTDRKLIRSLAKRLAEKNSDAPRLRAAVRGAIAGRPGKENGGILAALRRSPLVGVELDVKRSVTRGRRVDM